MTCSKEETGSYAQQSRYSDPGPYGASLDGIPTEPKAFGAVTRNIIVHYCMYANQVMVANRPSIHLRWLTATLATDTKRHEGKALAEPRPLAQRVQGCCRDHTLFCVGVLRRHGIPARSRVGFASYFPPGYRHDHVVVEVHNGSRWVRFDPEITEPNHYAPGSVRHASGPKRSVCHQRGSLAGLPRRRDRPGNLRRGARGRDRWAMDPQRYVLLELARRHGDELLL
jgi:Transglutaminase-like superfamily